jgi:ribulose-phosphate 3-epimerase
MLSADPTRFAQELIDVECSGANCIHWDIMDGSFVDAITFGAHIIAAHRKMSALRFDAHLMVVNPEKHIESFAKAGADAIIVHQEACQHLHRSLSSIRDLKKLAGVALNPATPIESIQHCLDVVDIVLVMSVNPGKSGQTFIPSQLHKIRKLRELLPETVEICVDGGINSETSKECIANGANSLVVGSFLFKNGKENYQKAISSIISATDHV